MAAKNPIGEPDPAPFKVHLMTKAERIMRARTRNEKPGASCGQPLGRTNLLALPRERPT
jgi:hypothetical protein